MTPDESAWAQTLRELLTSVPTLSGVVRPTNAPSWRAEVVPALTAAIAALEAQQQAPRHVFEGMGEFCLRCSSAAQWRLRHEHPAMVPAAHAPSETAKDERIRALEGALLNARNSLQWIADGRCGPRSGDVQQYAGDSAGIAWRRLYPHQSWCRTEHEGACVPSERPEP